MISPFDYSHFVPQPRELRQCEHSARVRCAARRRSSGRTAVAPGVPCVPNATAESKLVVATTYAPFGVAAMTNTRSVLGTTRASSSGRKHH
jgi:hypothetical protein